MTILGASYDTPADNLAFAESQQFRFRLLTDSEHRVATAYGAARDRSNKFADFPRRYSFLIDPQGIIYKSYDVTDVASHADRVIADVEQASQSS